MKLTAKTITIESAPVTVGTEVSSWEDSLLASAPAFMCEETVSEGRADITSIENWEKFGADAGLDYKAIRVQIATLAATVGWSNMTASEKEIAARWFAVDKTKRSEIYTTAQQVVLGRDFNSQSIACREVRANNAICEVYNRLESSEAYAVMLECDDLIRKYIDRGLEGTASGDPEGLYDYLEATAGTSYASTGLAAKSYVPDGLTMSQLVAKVMGFLQNGA